MRLLVIGCHSFIGSAVAAWAIDQGHEVVGYARKGPKQAYSVIKGSLEDLKDKKAELVASKPDVVIHCIAYTEQHAKDFVGIWQGQEAPVIVLSSIDCYQAFQDASQLREEAGLPISEADPICQEAYYRRGFADQLFAEKYDKNQVTGIFIAADQAQKLQVTVLRLPSVYGPGDRKLTLQKKILRRVYDKQNVLAFGHLEQNFVMTAGYIENIAAAIVHAAVNRKLSQKIYNIGERKSRTQRRWASLIAAATGFEFTYKTINDAILCGQPELMHAPPRTILVSTENFYRDSGFDEPISLSQAVAATCKYALANPQILGPKPHYENEGEMINAYEKFVGMWIEE